jgi:hypothetical protein
MEEQKSIYVVYVGIGNLEDDDIEEIVSKTASKVAPIFSDMNCEVIVLPSRLTIDSRIECINPQYITNEALLKKHKFQMEILHGNLKDYEEEILKK